jgi:hypothetical protein
VDGATEADATLVKNVAHGTQTVSFTGLTASTTYYFQIYPYTNSGSDIDYKVGSEPQASATTDAPASVVDPSAGVVYISEVSDALAYQNEFIELYNNSDDIIDLSNCELQRFSSAGSHEYTWSFSSGNQIPAKGYVVVSRGNDQSTFENEWGAMPAGCNFYQGNNNLYFGTGRRWKLIFNDGSKAEVIIDDTQTGVSGSGDRAIQESPGTWTVGNSGDGTPGAQGGDNSSLPIELLSFGAVKHDKGVLLEWTTATEINNDYFTIERSVDGVSFEEITRIAGAGNSLQEIEYNAWDLETTQSTVYYRLKQTDFDGEFTYSKTIVLVSSSDDLAIDQITHLDQLLNIQLNQLASNVLLELYDANGRLVYKELQNQSDIKISTAPFQSGIYVLRIVSNEAVINRKLVL